MAFENLCMYCFEENGGADVCPHCGRDARAAVPQIQLLPGTLVYNERFLIGRALGQDAGGIVYSALDTKKGVKIRIREYLPRDCARRLNSGEVVPEPGAEEQFDAGMNKLRASVEGVEDPSKRHFFFEENGTGYIAQRKAAGAGMADGGDADEGDRRGARMALVVALAALLVLGVAVGVIALVNYFTSSTDKRTDAPLTSAADIWQAPNTPTPTPYAAATFAAISDPTHSWMDFTNPDLEGNSSDFKKPTPAPTPEGEFESINANSDPEMIKKLQTLLNNLGWLGADKVTGSYDADTKQAVKDFQQYMNDTYALDPKLAVDGIAGKNTLTWLLKTDISMKPTPTPAPVTPSPTQAGRVINENSTPEEIKYVQLQLANLGILKNSDVDGKYGNTTKNAVKTFQMRVNDILGYDAVNEDGVCDDRTLAYLDYYVNWWESNQPTPAPTKAPTSAPTQAPQATPTAEPEPEYSGEVIDENSHKESIQRVQEMLITLGYLEGKADGVYGKQTAAAVSAFQQDVHDNVDSKVKVTGKVDVLTREYLEMYSSQAEDETPAPEAAAPAITVTGAVTYENGIYTVGEDGVKISWSSNGAQNYCVELTRQDGTLVNKEASTPYTALSMTMGNLSGTEPYRFTVTVLNSDGSRGASSYVQLIAVGIGGGDDTTDIGIPAITVTGSLSYSDGFYRIGADGAGLNWSAAGAEAYSLYLTDSEGTEVYSSLNTDITSYHLEASAIEPGMKYLFTVVAIPDGGDEGAGARSSVGLLLDVQNTPEPTQAPSTDFTEPVITVTGAVGEMDGIHFIGTDKAAISWAAEGDVRAYSVYLTKADGTALSSVTETNNQSMNVDPATMTDGEIYTLTVVAIPVNGTEAHGKSAFVNFQLYDGRTPEPTEEPLAEIGQVGLTVTGHKTSDGGIFYAGDSDITVAWYAEGNVKGYDVTVSDANGTILIDREQVSAVSMTIEPGDLTEDVVYTVSVTAVPAGGTAADGNSAAVKLVRASTAKPSDLTITVTGHEEEDTGTYYIGSEPVTIEWNSANAIGYNIYLSDMSNTVLKAVENTTETSLTMAADGMVYGEVYTLTVHAISATGNTDDNISAAVYLTAANEPAVLGDIAITVTGHIAYKNDVYVLSEDGATVQWYAENAVKYNAAILDSDGKAIKTFDGLTDTEFTVDVSTMTAGSVYALSVAPVDADGNVSTAGSVMLMLEKPEPTPEPKPTVGIPAITVTGHKSYDEETGIYTVGSDEVTVAWVAENAAVYSVYIYGEDNRVINKAEKSEVESMTIKPDVMPADEIVTVAVTGFDKDGESGENAYVKLILAEPEPTPEPTAEPTPEPVQVGKPEMTVTGHTEVIDGVYMIEKGAAVTIGWSAENAEKYNVAIYNSAKEKLTSADGTIQTSMTVDTSTMAAGETYAVQATPIGADGTAGDYSYVLLSLVKDEPTPEPTAEPTPTPEPVTVGNAYITVNGCEERDGKYYVGDGDVTISWIADGAASYDVTIGSNSWNVTKTETTLKLSDIPENSTTIVTVTGVASDGTTRGATDTVEIVREAAAKWPIKPDSKPEYIKEMQVRLYNMGWISAENAALVEQGVLDDITVQAVIDFQFHILTVMPELETEITPTNLTDRIIDEVTLEYMFDATLDLTKPIE